MVRLRVAVEKSCFFAQVRALIYKISRVPRLGCGVAGNIQDMPGSETGKRGCDAGLEPGTRRVDNAAVRP